MTEQVPAGWIDMTGVQLKVGDRIACALTLGRSAELRLGTIVGWSDTTPEYGARRRSLKVLWDRSSSDARYEALYPDRKLSSWGPVATGKPTSIQYEHMKHLVVRP